MTAPEVTYEVEVRVNAVLHRLGDDPDAIPDTVERLSVVGYVSDHPPYEKRHSTQRVGDTVADTIRAAADAAALTVNALPQGPTRDSDICF